MNTKYFKVQAKCGHVGRNHYVLKWFYVKALTGQEAAKVVRETPRVKHNQKKAIKDVIEIHFEEYLAGLKINSEDMYFKCTNKQEQEFYKCVKPEEIYPEEKKPNYKKKRNGQRIKNNFLEKEMKREIRGVIN